MPMVSQLRMCDLDSSSFYNLKIYFSIPVAKAEEPPHPFICLQISYPRLQSHFSYLVIGSSSGIIPRRSIFHFHYQIILQALYPEVMRVNVVLTYLGIVHWLCYTRLETVHVFSKLVMQIITANHFSFIKNPYNHNCWYIEYFYFITLVPYNHNCVSYLVSFYIARYLSQVQSLINYGCNTYSIKNSLSVFMC